MFWIKKFLILLTGLSGLTILVGCSGAKNLPTTAGITMLAITTPIATQISLPAVMETDPALKPIITATASASTSLISNDTNELLKSAVANLQRATSFQIAAHDIRAYQNIDTRGKTVTVYGETNTNYAIIRIPTLKVHQYNAYRYDPQAAFKIENVYVYEDTKSGKYLIRYDDNAAEEIDLHQIDPMAGDIYQTLITYFDRAKFVTESNGIAVYSLEHPEWYKLKGAVGFADLGFLTLQKNSEQLIKQYVAENYPNVKTIRFTISVAVDTQTITKVVVDDKHFMHSVWEAAALALIQKEGGDPRTLAHYKVMDVNGCEYLFSKYNQVQNFEIP